MRRLLVCTALASGFAWGAAFAQPVGPTPAPSTSVAPEAASSATGESPRELAREHFGRGVALFADEAWDAALVEFMKSRALFPTRNATKNAAICLRQLHRFDEALDMFELLVTEFPTMPPDAKAQAEKEIASLQKLVGTIQLKGGEAGATIVIDGRNRGTLPTVPVRVSVGTHVVRVRKEGFGPFEAQVQVASGQTSVVDVTMKLLEKAGRLRVTETSGKVVNVLVDNVVVGKTPWEGLLPVGDHMVFLDGGGNLGTEPTRAPITLGQTTPLNLVAEELDGHVRLQPNPNVASVALDGVVLGRGLWEGKVRSGKHRVEASLDGYLPFVRDVTVPKGERAVIPVALEPDPKASLTFKQAEEARKAWIARRGHTFKFEIRGQGILIVKPPVPVLRGYVDRGPGAGPTGENDRRHAEDEISGGGAGGIGLRAAYLYWDLPDPSVGRLWSAFRMGTGFDVNYGYWHTLGPFPQSTYESTGTTTTYYKPGAWGKGWLVNVPFTFGYQLGVGTFRGQDWTGLIFGIAYVPTWSILVHEVAATTSTLRLGGFELSIDFVDKPLKAKEKVPSGKFFIYVLPPANDQPLIVNIGGGAAWY